MENDKKIKNIVFDMGFVLIDFRWRGYLRDLGFSQEKIDFFGKNVVNSKYWHKLDMGLIKQAEARACLLKELPAEYKDDINLFWDRVNEIAIEYPYSYKLVKGLKDAGYNIYLLSNYPEEMGEVHWASCSFLPLVDGYVMSSKVKMCKPDPAIYMSLRDKYDLDLNESVFIDDREDNCEASERLGMAAIVFKGYDELISSFKERGIELV